MVRQPQSVIPRPCGGRFIHPTDIALGASVADIYNAYLSSDDPLGGNQTTSYAGLVPFEAVDVDLALADPLNATAGPSAGDRVMCLSCHRSHASPFADIGRWDFLATFLNTDSHPQLTDGGATATDVANRYYQYTFSNAQRSLCNKCHAKDLGDAPPGP
jgi:cytochrome c5